MSIQTIMRVETQNNRVIELLQVGIEHYVDSRIVAKGLDIQHEHFMRTLEKYQERLERWGQLRFQNGLGYRPQGGGNPQKYALLNRSQLLFAISLSRNTEEVIEWKEAIIDALDQLEKQVRSLKAPRSQKQIEAPKEVLEKKILGVITRRTKKATTEREKWITPAVVVNRLHNRYSIEDVEQALNTLHLQKCIAVNPSNNTRVVKYRLKSNQ